MAKRQKKAPGGANWMDTYGDMVTLLLCFFVLLYSMSSISEEKWKIIVKSFNPDAIESSQIVTTTEPNDNLEDPVEGSHDPAEIQETFDELYRQLVQYVEQNNYQNDIELSKGDDYTFITFRDNVFFDGESYNIRPEGQHILDGICVALEKASASIDEVRVLGHTSQATPGVPNEPVSDRFLASNRATGGRQDSPVIGPGSTDGQQSTDQKYYGTEVSCGGFLWPVPRHQRCGYERGPRKEQAR